MKQRTDKLVRQSNFTSELCVHPLSLRSLSTPYCAADPQEAASCVDMARRRERARWREI